MTLPGSNSNLNDSQQINPGFYEWIQQQSTLQRMAAVPGPSGLVNENQPFANPGLCDLWWQQSPYLQYPNYPWYQYSQFTADAMRQPNMMQNGLHLSEDPPKKGRISFSKEQIAALEARFQLDNHIRKPERETFARMWMLKPEQVKIWFQNQRYKRRKQDKRPDSGDRSIRDESSCDTSNKTSQPSTPENSCSNPDSDVGSALFGQTAPGTPQLPDFMTPNRMYPSYPVPSNTGVPAGFNQNLMNQIGATNSSMEYQVPSHQWNQHGAQFFDRRETKPPTVPTPGTGFQQNYESL